MTVHSPLFFRKIIEIEGFALRAAILHECQNYLGGGAVLEEARKIEVHLKIKIAVAVRRVISKRSHEKIGDVNSLVAIKRMLASLKTPPF